MVHVHYRSTFHGVAIYTLPQSSTRLRCGQPTSGGELNCVSTNTFSTPSRRLSNAVYNFAKSSNGTRCVIMLCGCQTHCNITGRGGLQCWIKLACPDIIVQDFFPVQPDRRLSVTNQSDTYARHVRKRSDQVHKHLPFSISAPIWN